MGFPLAQHLLLEGHHIKGSTTSNNKLQVLEKNGIESYQICLPDDVPACKTSQFWKSDYLFLNIPPGRKKEDVVESYCEKVRSIRSILESSDSTIQNIIFASSTSAYPNKSGYFSEEDAVLDESIKPSGEAVLHAEKILQNSEKFDTVVLRFGGLYGYNRHPVNHLSGRTNISSPLKPVNLIHQDDCIRIIRYLIKNDITNGIFNAVSDGHPPRKTLYQSAAKHFGITPPLFDEESDSIERIISNEKLKRDLNFTFTYPNPLDHTA